MKSLPLRIPLAALLCLVPAASNAQLGQSQAGMDPTLIKLFGKHENFSTKGELKLLIPGQKDVMTLPMDMAFSDGKMRTEVDMKAMGMDRVVSIYRPDKKATFVIMPAFKAYATMAMTKEQTDKIGKESKIESSKLGKETLDGHPCEKSKEIISDADGKKQEALVWRATDLKDFPIQIVAKSDQGDFTIHYKKVDFTKPEARLFEPPKDFKAYDDLQTMMMTVMQQMMQGQGAPP